MLENNPSPKKEGKADIEKIVEKLKNSGYGWISKEDLSRITNLVLESAEKAK